MKKEIIFIFILICGCKQRPGTVNLNRIDFYANPGIEISNLSEIATEIDYIPLQIKGSGISEIRITDDRYFVKNYSEEIECLDKNGRFLYKLSKKGNASDEYGSIPNYDVNSGGQLLALSTYKAIKIYENDGTGFVFLKSVDITNPVTLSFVPGKINLLLSCINPGNIPFVDILINPEGDTLATRPNGNRLKKDLRPSIFLRGIQYKYDKSLFFKEPFNDTVYTVGMSDNISPYLVIDSHGKQITPGIVDRTQSGKSKKKLWDYFNIMFFSETSRYMIALIIFRKSESVRIYDKALSKYFSFSNSSLYIKDNINGGVDFTPKYCDGNKLYYWISASELIDHVAGGGFKNSEAIPERKAYLRKITDSLQDTDSQILIVVTPKE